MANKGKKERKNKVEKLEYLNDEWSFFIFSLMFSFDGENKNSINKL